MTYTEDQLKVMSDHQVEEEVAKKLGLRYQSIEKRVTLLPHIIEREVRVYLDNGRHNTFSPCKEWNDAISIAGANKLDVNFDRGVISSPLYQPDCKAYGKHIERSNPNLRRAICEVFLMLPK